MSRLKLPLIMSIMICGVAASAQDHGRIKRKPPSATEAERIASDTAMNDSLYSAREISSPPIADFSFSAAWHRTGSPTISCPFPTLFRLAKTNRGPRIFEWRLLQAQGCRKNAADSTALDR